MFSFCALLGVVSVVFGAMAAPPGHMEPLGRQSRSLGPVEETDWPISARRFHEDYVAKNKPLIIRGAAVDWPAMTRWAEDSDMAKRFGALKIEVGEQRECEV